MGTLTNSWVKTIIQHAKKEEIKTKVQIMNYKINSWLYYFPQKIRGVFALGWDYKTQLYSILQGFYLYLFLLFSIKPLYMENLSLFITLILQSLPSTCRVGDISSKIHYKNLGL